MIFYEKPAIMLNLFWMVYALKKSARRRLVRRSNHKPIERQKQKQKQTKTIFHGLDLYFVCSLLDTLVDLYYFFSQLKYC